LILILGTGVGSSNLPAPTNRIKELDRQSPVWFTNFSEKFAKLIGIAVLKDAGGMQNTQRRIAEEGTAEALAMVQSIKGQP